MNRRNLLRTVVGAIGAAITNNGALATVAGQLQTFRGSESTSLLATLTQSRTECIRLSTSLATISPTNKGVASLEISSAVEELRCLVDQAILFCRTRSQHSPAFLQATKDSIERVCRCLQESSAREVLGSTVIVEAATSFQSTAVLLADATIA